MKFSMAVVALAGLAAAAPARPKNASPYHDLTDLKYANSRPLTLAAKEKQEHNLETRATEVRTPVKDNRNLHYVRNKPMAVSQ